MTRANKPVPGVQIACFDLCQAIGMEIEGFGQRITADAVHFPATHKHIKSNLDRLKRFADRALVAIDAAQSDWHKEIDHDDPC